MSAVFRKGVDGGSKCRAGMGVTKVRLDGWCEDVLEQQGMTVDAARQFLKDRKEWRA